MRLEEYRREAAREMELSSENFEIASNLDVLLGDLILEKDEAKKHRREEQNEHTDRKTRLTAAGATGPQLAFSRKRQRIDVEDLTEHDTPPKNFKMVLDICVKERLRFDNRKR